MSSISICSLLVYCLEGLADLLEHLFADGLVLRPHGVGWYALKVRAVLPAGEKRVLLAAQDGDGDGGDLDFSGLGHGFAPYSSGETPDGTCTFGAAVFFPRQYAVRVYSRQLTADEIAWNRMIDRHRYVGESLAALPRPALSVAPIPEQDWDGVHAFKPSVRVTNDILGEILTEGVDYEVGNAAWMSDETALTAERAQVCGEQDFG